MTKPTLSLFAALLTGASLLSSALGQLDVGESSDPISFGLFEDGALTSSGLDQLEGKVLVVYYYTPW